MQAERTFNMEKHMDINDWTEYKCKTGQTLFIKVAGGHKWPTGSRSSGLLSQCKSFCTVATQTDDIGCSNGCTSVFINDSMNTRKSFNDHKLNDIREHERDDLVTMVTSRHVVSKQTSPKTYASELSAVLRVLEEEFDSPSDEEEPRSSSPITDKNAPNYILNDNERSVIDVEYSVTEEERRETALQVAEEIKQPSMFEERTETVIIDREELEQPLFAEKRRDGVIIESEQIAQTSEQETPLNEEFKCLTCKEVLYCKTAYNEHLLTHRRHKCPHCDKEYSYKFYLNYHLVTHGQKNKPVRCSFCDTQFENREEHDVHVKTHVGDRPYVCTICDKRFRTRNNFKAHAQRVHTDGRKYKCTYCDQAFQRSDHLHRHLRKHTGEKPHKCIFCGKGFGRKDNLTCHLRVHMK